MKLSVPINHWRSDPSGWIGAAVMFIFAGIAGWRWQSTGLIYFALTLLRDLAATWFLLTRKEDIARARFGKADVLAYISSAMSFAYLSPSKTVSALLFLSSNILAITGFTLATVALFEIGQSFGVSPANRGRVSSGVYRYIKHPMYVGYSISELGMILLNPWNVLPFVLSFSLYCFRVRSEELVLKNT